MRWCKFSLRVRFVHSPSGARGYNELIPASNCIWEFSIDSAFCLMDSKPKQKDERLVWELHQLLNKSLVWRSQRGQLQLLPSGAYE